MARCRWKIKILKNADIWLSCHKSFRNMTDARLLASNVKKPTLFSLRLSLWLFILFFIIICHTAQELPLTYFSFYCQMIRSRASKTAVNRGCLTRFSQSFQAYPTVFISRWSLLRFQDRSSMLTILKVELDSWIYGWCEGLTGVPPQIPTA